MTDPTPKTTSDPTAKTTTAFAGQVGTVVLYQPSEQEWPMGYHQHPAIVTSWDTDTLKADLTLFLNNFQYLLAKKGVSEGTGDSTFQQLGTPSTTQQAINQARQEARTAAPPPTTAAPTTPPPSAATQKQSHV